MDIGPEVGLLEQMAALFSALFKKQTNKNKPVKKQIYSYQGRRGEGKDNLWGWNGHIHTTA